MKALTLLIRLEQAIIGKAGEFMIVEIGKERLNGNFFH